MAAALGILLSASPVMATHQTGYPWRRYAYGSYSWNVWYYYDANMSTAFRNATVNGAGRWNLAESELRYRVYTSSAPSADLLVRMYNFPAPWPSNTLGSTVLRGCSTPTTTCGGTISISSEKPFYTGTGTPSNTQFDLITLVVHEFGHANEFYHETSNMAYVMYPTANLGQKRRCPVAHEVSTLRSMYGANATALSCTN